MFRLEINEFKFFRGSRNRTFDKPKEFGIRKI